ncbi:sulfurtransferase [Buchnera aphidicola (Nipponaphis monzeni)]|uniref:Sulfurtransferase n=1 Tax=Buchnera aphidicola (Nipponaphis monzeni) TaxID=2495405 RepID=A0A455TAJ5_9GAMM|nr:sulfurtransferase TusA [Buchnera aphidicola]BBI01342.1 sulfurtransferase [Buchnera aphidicola (Nipponaphis monzeni)]
MKIFYKNFLDLRKSTCPDTIMFLRQKIRHIACKELLLVLSNDVSTKRDIPIFCYFMNHILVEYYICNTPYRYLLQK